MHNREQKQDAFSVIRQHFYDLKEFLDLRNAFVHERRRDKYIAEPHEDIVCEIERIRDDLYNRSFYSLQGLLYIKYNIQPSSILK